MQAAAKRGKTCIQLPRARKHASSFQAWKNMQPVPSAGKHASSCQARENMQPAAKRGKTYKKQKHTGCELLSRFLLVLKKATQIACKRYNWRRFPKVFAVTKTQLLFIQNQYFQMYTTKQAYFKPV